jgi:DNA-binding transcriptional LysR family regulator
MIELRHLAYFRAVAEHGSIAKAAAALHMTQPTLSRQIAQLEREVGHRLLRRTSRGTSLTGAGEGLAEHVATIFVQVDRIPDVLASHEQAQRLVHLGIPPGIPELWFEGFRGALAAAAPHLRLRPHEATSEEQRQLLRRGLIDVGLLHLDPPELHAALVLAHSFGCAVRHPSKVAAGSSVTLEDLDGLRVMAHSSHESPGQEARLRAAAEIQGLHIVWLFRQFSEHAALIAETSDADVVLLGEPSARKYFPSWPWLPLNPSDSVNATVHTWAAWADQDLPHLEQILDAMRGASGGRLPDAV